MTTKQLSTLESFPDQFAAVWMKLGLTMSVQDLHRLAFEKRITAAERPNWTSYTDQEASRAIGFFLAVLEGYKSQWRKRCQEYSEKRAAQQSEDQKIKLQCSLLQDVHSWMQANDRHHKWPERFEFVKTIEGQHYYRLRGEIVSLLDQFESKNEFNLVQLMHWYDGKSFQEMYDLVTVPGYTGPLFKRLFEMRHEADIRY